MIDQLAGRDRAVTKSHNQNILKPLFESGFDRVLLLLCARFTWQWDRWPKSAAGAAGSVALASGWPFIFELITLALAPDAALHTLRAIVWLAAVSALDMLIMFCAWHAWNLWVNAAVSMENLVSGCAGYDEILQWYSRMLSKGKQFALSIVFAISGCVFLWLISPAIRPHLEICSVSYLAISWMAAIAANAAYWIVVNSEMTRRLLSLRNLNMVWHSPASTPAIVKLSRGFGFAAAAVLAGALVTEYLAFRVSGYGHSALLSSLTIFVPALAAALALIVGLAPHLWLYAAVRNARAATLQILGRLITEKAPATRRTAEAIGGHVELYRLVEQSPGLPFSTAAMVQYAAAVLGSLVAYFLGR